MYYKLRVLRNNARYPSEIKIYIYSIELINKYIINSIF